MMILALFSLLLAVLALIHGLFICVQSCLLLDGVLIECHLDHQHGISQEMSSGINDEASEM